MMKVKMILFIGTFFVFTKLYSQTFSATGAAIPDSGLPPQSYPLNVFGIGAISSNFGLTSVCINISHPWVSDLEIFLKAPDGTVVPLSIQNGGSGQNYTGTCFSYNAINAVADGTAPFSGNYVPDGYIGAVNNGQNANGTWQLEIRDIALGETGSLLTWSLNFTNAAAPSPPSCNGNQPPGNTCATATPVCSFYGFCGLTSAAYTADSWAGFDAAFCGTVQNNAFVKFVAAATSMDFNVWVTSSTNYDGIQIFFYDAICDAGPVTDLGCYSPIRPGSSPTVVTASGLTPGNIYYMMIDGFAGDVCNYIIEPAPATGALAVSATAQRVCEGQSVQLIATGGNAVYTWTGAGLNTFIGSTVTASPVINTTYEVSSTDPGGLCPVTKRITINVISRPGVPVVSDTPVYCQRAAAMPLTAAGTGLRWYTMPAGAPGSQQAIIPSTATAGLVTYYVSQTDATTGCESTLVPASANILASPSLGSDKIVKACNGTAATLTGYINNTGLFTNWSLNGIDIRPPENVTIAGHYQLEVHNNNNCADTAVIQLNFQPKLYPSIRPDTLAVSGLPHQLHCSIASGYTWSPASLLNLSNVREPVAILYHDQEFIVQVSDDVGCTANDTIFIKVYKGTTYYVPNAFSPNGDGLNDVFRAIPVGIDHTELFKIANRYGKILFESADPYYKGWDGTYKNIRQATGSYIWLLRGIDKYGKKVTMKGTVVLIQ